MRKRNNEDRPVFSQCSRQQNDTGNNKKDIGREDCQFFPGEVIDKVFTLREKIGQGGMARVYRAEVELDRFDYTLLYAYSGLEALCQHERRQRAKELTANLTEHSLELSTVRNILQSHNIPLPGREAALKIAREKTPLERFEAEWMNLLCLNHPNLIEVYGGGEHRGHPYYVMELIESIIPAKEIVLRFSLLEKLEIIIQSARGLAYLHKNGIIHRDIKPQNLITFSGEDGNIITKVSDLGLCKDIDQSLNLTSSQSFLGTLNYIAPEQIEAPDCVDERSDIYGLGACLYEMATQKRPFNEKSSVWQFLSAVNNGEQARAPRKINRDVPLPLNNIVRKAMAVKPSKRYQNSEEFIADLEQFAEKLSKRSENISLSNEKERGKKAPRPGGKMAIPAAALFAFLLFLVYSVSLKNTEPDRIYFENFEENPGFLAEYTHRKNGYFQWKDSERYYKVRIKAPAEDPVWLLSRIFSEIKDRSFVMEADLRIQGEPDGAPVEMRLLNPPVFGHNLSSSVDLNPAIILRVSGSQIELLSSDLRRSYSLSHLPDNHWLQFRLVYDAEAETADISILNLLSREKIAGKSNISYTAPPFSMLALGRQTTADFSGPTEMDIDRLEIRKAPPSIHR